MKKIFVVTDNRLIFLKFSEILASYKKFSVHYYCSPRSSDLFSEEIEAGLIKTVDLKKHFSFLKDYNLGFSCHSKQIFPKDLVESTLCINIHPGYNPHNRGWYPQVFSIINNKTAGATVHVMDEEIDHGNIIAQRAVEINASDTSLDVYRRIQETEIELFKMTLPAILRGSFSSYSPSSEGNYNSIADFNALKELQLDEQKTVGETINLLRAMTHPPYKNCYFLDEQGRKVFVSLVLEME